MKGLKSYIMKITCGGYLISLKSLSVINFIIHLCWFWIPAAKIELTSFFDACSEDVSFWARCLLIMHSGMQESVALTQVSSIIVVSLGHPICLSEWCRFPVYPTPNLLVLGRYFANFIAWQLALVSMFRKLCLTSNWQALENCFVWNVVAS